MTNELNCFQCAPSVFGRILQSDLFRGESFEPDRFEAGLRVIYGNDGKIGVGDEVQTDGVAIVGPKVELNLGITQAQPRSPEIFLPTSTTSLPT